MKRIIAITIACLMAQPAMAFFKCTKNGKVVFQDTFCDQTATSVNMGKGRDSGTVAFEQRVEMMKAQCALMLREVPAWKDKSSVQIGTVYRGKSTTVIIDGTSLAVVQYLANVNAKNSYGGYVGNKPAVCFADIGDTRILKIQTF